MTNARTRQIALAATIVLAPGGFILGAALIARHLNNKRQARICDQAGSSRDFRGEERS